MPIQQGVCTSFKQELLVGTHNFTPTSGDAFKLALYANAATLGVATTVYATANEASGTGYTAGGKALSNVIPTVSGTTAYVDFADVTWSTSTLTARGGLIYNSTDANRAVYVMDFLTDQTSSAGDFTVVFPAADATNAIIRIV